MAATSRHAERIMITLAAASCGLLVLVHSGWRLEVQAQDYPEPEPESCLPIEDAVAKAANTVRFASDLDGHDSEFGIIVCEDEEGCHQTGRFTEGRPHDADIPYRDLERLMREAERDDCTPELVIHTHNYPPGSTYDEEEAGISGRPGDERCPPKCSGDAGFADKHKIPVIAIDVGPRAENCAHGYDPEAGSARTCCLDSDGNTVCADSTLPDAGPPQGD